MKELISNTSYNTIQQELFDLEQQYDELKEEVEYLKNIAKSISETWRAGEKRNQIIEEKRILLSELHDRIISIREVLRIMIDDLKLQQEEKEKEKEREQIRLASLQNKIAEDIEKRIRRTERQRREQFVREQRERERERREEFVREQREREQRESRGYRRSPKK